MKLLARVVKSMVLRPIRTLADGSYLAKVYSNDFDCRMDRDGILVRVIRYTLDDPQRVGHGEVHVLITNLLDEKLRPAMEMIILYHERWEEELTFDEQKTHQDPRRATKPAQLRSETQAGVIQEIYALSLGHFVIRSLMFEAAGDGGAGPGRAVVHRVLSDPEVPAPGMRPQDARDVRDVVRSYAVDGFCPLGAERDG